MTITHECAIAFKEWAAVCLALRTGKQSVIMRKGGIHEGRDGFRVAHSEFWLFPTYLHESTSGLASDAAPLLETALNDKPPSGRLWLRDFCVVKAVTEITEPREFKAFANRHVLSEATVQQRFDYRQPGLFVLDVEIWTQAEPWDIADEPRFGGCRSWVELTESLPTARLHRAV